MHASLDFSYENITLVCIPAHVALAATIVAVWLRHYLSTSTMAFTLQPPAVPVGSVASRRAQPAPTALLQGCTPLQPAFSNALIHSCEARCASRIATTRRNQSLVVRAQAPSQQQEAEPASMDRKKGRMTYRPQSFGEMVQDAVRCVQDGIKDGLTRMEVEFPPVPVKLDGYKGASDVFIDSNVQLALAAARQLAATGRKVHVLMPDQGEYDRTYKMFKSSLEVIGQNVTLGHLKEGAGWNWSVEGLFNGFAPESKDAGAAADTYLMINATCVELFNVKDYVQKNAPEGSGKVVVLWNLELDSLRGDMGLPAFPPKDMHYEFLSYFRPVFYLRTRDYSKSVPVAPYLINYSGALFREYPGPWQVMLRQDSGEYACIAEDVVRYNLGELKEELQAAMGLATEEEGSAMQVLRRGLKNSTWWEDDYEVEKSHEWRL